MVLIAPSILSADFSKLGDDVAKMTTSGADWAHIDVMDGMFVPNITIGPVVIKSIRKCTNIDFDVHLMIENPVRYVDAFALSGADWITVHAEAKNAESAIERIKFQGKKCGISLKPSTPVSAVEPYLDKLDLILVMTVEPGFGGQSFMEECLPKISQLKEMIHETGSKTLISVDGGINRDTGKMCVDAGADVLVAGSYLFSRKSMADEISIWKKF